MREATSGYDASRAGLEGHAVGPAVADHLLDLLDGEVEVALLLEHLHQQVPGLQVLGVGVAQQLQRADGAAHLLVLQGHPGRLQRGAALLQRLRPLGDVPDLAVAGRGVLVVARLLEALGGALHVAGAAVHLGGPHQLACLLEQAGAAAEVLEVAVDLRGLERVAGGGVVLGGELALVALLVHARQDQAGHLVGSLALQRPGGGGQVAVQVGLHRRRAAGEEQPLAVGEVELDRLGLEARDAHGKLRHAVAAAHHQHVLAALHPEPHRAAPRVAQRERQPAPGHQRVVHRALVPGHLHVHRALLGTEVEVDAHGVTAAHANLLLVEVRGDHGLVVGGLHEAVDGDVPAAGGNLPEVGLARHQVTLGAPRGPGASPGALGRGGARRARPLASRAAAARHAHAEGAAQLRGVLDGHDHVALAVEEEQGAEQPRHQQRGRHRQGLRARQPRVGQPAVDGVDGVGHQALPAVGQREHGVLLHLGHALRPGASVASRGVEHLSQRLLGDLRQARLRLRRRGLFIGGVGVGVGVVRGRGGVLGTRCPLRERARHGLGELGQRALRRGRRTPEAHGQRDGAACHEPEDRVSTEA
jgi:hypothetical protein